MTLLLKAPLKKVYSHVLTLYLYVLPGWDIGQCRPTYIIYIPNVGLLTYTP